MAPLSEACRTTYKKTLGNGTKVYECAADGQWRIGVVTFGGYSLALVVDAASQYQAIGPHPDIIHLSSQFLRAATSGPIEVRISTIRTGNQFTNLAVELYQQDTLKVTSGLIFGNFDQISTSAVAGVSMPITHSPLHPLTVHPTEAKMSPRHRAQQFSVHYEWSHDPHYQERNDSFATGERNLEGMQTGTWLRLRESQDVKMSPAFIPVFADMPQPPWQLLSEEHRAGRIFWHPSLSITIEFKCRLPLGSQFASHTMAVFGWKRHLKDGIWSDSAEIWTAPSELGDKADVDENWREKMICVAVANQLAYMAPPDINRRYAEQKKSKL